MSKTVYLIPEGKLKVRHPQGGHLPAEGDYVVLDTYWRKRLADKSVIEGKPPKPAKTADAKE